MTYIQETQDYVRTIHFKLKKTHGIVKSETHNCTIKLSVHTALRVILPRQNVRPKFVCDGITLEKFETQIHHLSISLTSPGFFF